MDCLFPRECAGCERNLLREETIMCLHCRLKIQRRPRISELTMQNRFTYPIIRSHSLGNYHQNGILQGLIHKMKYHKRPEIGVELGKLLAQSTSLPTSGTLIPVPQTRAKIRKRGYNQATQIALGLSMISGLKIESHFLIRSAHKRSQTKMNRQMRFENMVDTLITNRNYKVCDPVWLVDDVVTTGATLNACLHALAKGGIQKMGIIVLASA